MSTSTPSLEGHVVHLLQRWDDAVPPPSLRTRPRLGAAARFAIAALLIVASALAVFVVFILWTEETPGWWFSLLFTVIAVGLVLALWIGFAGALRSGVQREEASARWAEMAGAVRMSSGVVVARDVGTNEDGSVSQFDLTVKTERGASVTGTWRPQSSNRSVLQSQVPGVGATVRVWRNEGGPDADPVVIEALDPTVVPATGPARIPKYLD